MENFLKGNLFSKITKPIPEEICKTILRQGKIRIERILSKGQASPKNFWYNQEENEWALLLQGKVKLRLKNKLTSLKRGDYVNIPAHCKHRVEWTDPKQTTIWLAIFYP